MGTIPIQTITTPRLPVAYFTFGSGQRPFVILPGASVRSVMLSADMIAAAFSAFTADYTVYVFDKPQPDSPDYGAQAMAEDTAAAMMALGICDACVFGASLGGMMAQHLAASHPALVHKLVLGSTLLRQNEQSRQVLDTWIALSDALDSAALDQHIWAHVYSPAYYQQYQSAFDSMTGTATVEELRQFSIQARACRTFDGQALADKITCPTLVIGSRDDRAIAGDSSLLLAEALHCPCYLYEGYGHAVYDEAPDYRGRLLAFFAD